MDESDSIVDRLGLVALLRFGEEPVVGCFGEQEAEDADGTGDELYSSFGVIKLVVLMLSIFISLLS